MSRVSTLLGPLRAAVASFLITLTVCDNIMTVAVVSGESMCPTLNPVGGRFSDLVLVSKCKCGISSLKHGDLVTLTSPRNPKETLVKRIKGMEGDYVETRSYKTRHVIVPSGHLWIEGDNSERSVDSNSYGPVSQNLVTGKLLFVLWPSFRNLINS